MNSSPSLLSGESAEAAIALFNAGLNDANLLVSVLFVQSFISNDVSLPLPLPHYPLELTAVDMTNNK